VSEKFLSISEIEELIRLIVGSQFKGFCKYEGEEFLVKSVMEYLYTVPPNSFDSVDMWEFIFDKIVRRKSGDMLPWESRE
jgi:hypothetical protein